VEAAVEVAVVAEMEMMTMMRVARQVMGPGEVSALTTPVALP